MEMVVFRAKPVWVNVVCLLQMSLIEKNDVQWCARVGDVGRLLFRRCKAFWEETVGSVFSKYRLGDLEIPFLKESENPN